MEPPTRIPISRRASMASVPLQTSIRDNDNLPPTRIPVSKRYSITHRDPGDQSELQEAYTRSVDVYGSEVPMSPSRSPSQHSPQTPPTLTVDEALVSRIPHSSSSYNLKSHVSTPKDDRGLSRIPQSKVRHAVALQSLSPQPRHVSSPGLQSPLMDDVIPLSPAPHPRKRGSTASTKVIDGLQTELAYMRMQVDKVRQDFMGSQRVVESLTRQVHDGKETKTRLEREKDQLASVINRKDRLLQETAEQRKAAETERDELRIAKTALEKSTKKNMAQMTSQVTDAQQAQQRAESECSSLRDSVKSLREVWARETKAVKDEWKQVTRQHAKERDESKLQHANLLRLIKANESDRARLEQLARDVLERSTTSSAEYEKQLAELQTAVCRHAAETEQARQTARQIAFELQHLRRLMRAEPRQDLDDI